MFGTVVVAPVVEEALVEDVMSILDFGAAGEETA